MIENRQVSRRAGRAQGPVRPDAALLRRLPRSRRLPGVLLTQIECAGRSVAESLRPLVASEAASDGPVVVVLPERRTPVFGALATGGSSGILRQLQDIPNTWVVTLAA